MSLGLITIAVMSSLFVSGCSIHRKVDNSNGNIQGNTAAPTSAIPKADNADEIKAALKNMKDAYAIEWSNDGTAVAFARGDKETVNGQMFLWKLGDREPVSIGDKDLEICNFYWSPDSRHVIADIGTSVVRYGIIASSEEASEVLEIEYIGPPLWSPDSKWIAVGTLSDIEPAVFIELERTVDLTLFNIETQEKKIIEKGTADYYYSQDSWSKDGKLNYSKCYFSEKGSEHLVYKYEKQ
jgi:outer membrane murein-binding lipoprotein Lpp